MHMCRRCWLQMEDRQRAMNVFQFSCCSESSISFSFASFMSLWLSPMKGRHSSSIWRYDKAKICKRQIPTRPLLVYHHGILIVALWESAVCRFWLYYRRCLPHFPPYPSRNSCYLEARFRYWCSFLHKQYKFNNSWKSSMWPIDKQILVLVCFYNI